MSRQMITMYQMNDAMICTDPAGNCTGDDDVCTRIDKCPRHHAGNALGEGYIDRFIR